MRVNPRATGFAILLLALICPAQEFHPDIPRAWDDKAVDGLEVPLAQRDRSPRYMSAAEYYKLKVRPIYRSYPVYLKGREPAGYLESLKQKDPEIIFDPSKLHTKEDWIAAGKLVFESDTRFRPARALTVDDIPLPAATVSTVSKQGVLPGFGFRYYIREKGVLEFGINSCSGCHTRQMQDGSFCEGAQGIPSPPRAVVLGARQETPDQMRRRLDNAWTNFGAPWVMSREERRRNLRLKSTRCDSPPTAPEYSNGRAQAGRTRFISRPSLAFRIANILMLQASSATALSAILCATPSSTKVSIPWGTSAISNPVRMQRALAQKKGRDTAMNSSTRSLSTSLPGSRRRTRTNSTSTHDKVRSSSNGRAASIATHRPFTPTTSPRQPRGSRFLMIFARPMTFWMSASELTHTLRSKRVEAQGSTKCLHCRAFGIAMPLATVDRPKPWKSGLTQRG